MQQQLVIGQDGLQQGVVGAPGHIAAAQGGEGVAACCNLSAYVVDQADHVHLVQSKLQGVWPTQGGGKQTAQVAAECNSGRWKHLCEKCMVGTNLRSILLQTEPCFLLIVLQHLLQAAKLFVAEQALEPAALIHVPLIPVLFLATALRFRGCGVTVGDRHVNCTAWI
jgi:hypothetical protein